MDIEVRPIAPDEFEAFVRATVASFGAIYHPEELERNRTEFEPGRSLAAFDGADIVGTAGGVSFDLTVPGGTLPALAVTGVGVIPTHRRRGVLRSLMRHQLDDARKAGTPLAILWASEGAIYPRFGYGVRRTRISRRSSRSPTTFPGGSSSHIGWREATTGRSSKL